MLRRQGLERRLFGWMLALALAPALFLVMVGVWLWVGSLDWVGTLGPWDRVAESGRLVFDAAAPAAESDSALAAALARHREELSASLRLARRWAFLERRLASMVPGLALGLALVIAGLALAASRRVARGLARPIGELAEWAGRLAREEPLPEPSVNEAREVAEVRALRAAFRRAESELADARRRALSAERVRIWGEMARRVAHEMKNPLTPLRLAAHRLSSAMQGDGEVRDHLRVLEEETARLEEMARQFAALGRPPAGPTSPVDLRELLGSLLASDVPPRIETHLAAPPDLPLVEGHYDALLRAFRNLIRNAVEALETTDGERRIEVGLAFVAPAPHEGGTAAHGWIDAVVADTGPGVPPGAEERVFEPDFTMRSRGTGLGLPIVRQVVHAHGGEVTATNRPEGGARFVVRLPVTAAVPAVPS